jgi:hypothetical protein
MKNRLKFKGNLRRENARGNAKLNARDVKWIAD